MKIKNPKTTIALIISILVMVWDGISDNATLFGINADTVTKVSFVLTMLALVFDKVSAQTTNKQ